MSGTMDGRTVYHVACEHGALQTRSINAYFQYFGQQLSQHLKYTDSKEGFSHIIGAVLQHIYLVTFTAYF